MKKYKNTAPIAFIADTHFGAKSFSKPVFNTMMGFFEDQFFPWCLENGIENVIHCGDLVHNRNMIDLWINQQIKTRFFKWFEDHGITLHVLVGNHDLYYKSSMEFNYLAENTKEFTNIIIYDKQEKINIGKYTFLMVPWVVNSKDFKFKHKADICCGHFETIGFRMTSHMYASDGFDQGLFDNFKYTFSGHFHITSRQKNILYLGTQYPITWNDFGEKKGFHILKDNFEIEFIENSVTPKFIKIYYDEFDGNQINHIAGLGNKNKSPASNEEVLDVVKHNFTKIITNNIENQTTFDSFYQSISRVSKDGYKIETIDSNEIIESFNIDDIEEQINEEADVLSMVNSYLNGMTFEKDIDKNYLIQMFEELYSDSSDNVVDE